MKKKKMASPVTKSSLWESQHLGSLCGGDLERRSRKQSVAAPKQSSGLQIPSKGLTSILLLCWAGKDCLNSRTLGSPPRVCTSKQRCHKETLNRHQEPLMLYMGKHNSGIFLGSECGHTQGQNRVQLKVMKLN